MVLLVVQHLADVGDGLAERTLAHHHAGPDPAHQFVLKIGRMQGVWEKVE
jgi:hypothetical protein